MSIQDRVQLHFYGAAGTVTGSATVLSYTHSNGQITRVLVDCGLFQGSQSDRIKNREVISYDPETLDAVILTHAHLDHSGLLPRLGKRYEGLVYTSRGTADLLKVMLLDSAKIQEEDAEYANRTGYSHHKPAEPLYDTDDARKILKQVRSFQYRQWVKINESVRFQFHRTGHIVGASSVEVQILDEGKTFTLGWSGDLGHHRSLTLEGPDPLFECDWLVLESTYGDRPSVCGESTDVQDMLLDSIRQTTDRAGVLVIPSFAVGRAQEVIYRIRALEVEGKLTPVPVILDSPMSEEATVIYLENEGEFKKGVPFLKDKKKFFPERFELVKNYQQSMETCERRGPLIVISASGMLQGGRVLHHLKKRLSSDKNGVLFVGYQAEGTKGHFLLGRPGELRIHHEPIPVKARIESIPGLSGHADQNELVQWVSATSRRPTHVFLNHGTPHAMQSLKVRLETEIGIPVTAVVTPGPVTGDRF